MKTIALLAVAGSMALAGCGVSDPYARSAPARDRPAQLSATDSARVAVGQFALLWTNWSWRSLADQRRALSRLAAEPLHSQLLAGAQRAGHGLGSARRIGHGHVLAVEIRYDTAVVVVSQSTSGVPAESDTGGVIAVYRARLIRQLGRWRISAWTSLTP